MARVRWLASVAPELDLPTFADADVEQMLPEICYGLRSLDELRNADWLALLQNKVGYERLPEIERLAPAELELPNGNRHSIAYEIGKSPVLAVRIQEMFGVSETPTCRRRASAGVAAPARTELPAATNNGGPRELLAKRISGG